MKQLTHSLIYPRLDFCVVRYLLLHIAEKLYNGYLHNVVWGECPCNWRPQTKPQSWLLKKERKFNITSFQESTKLLTAPSGIIFFKRIIA